MPRAPTIPKPAPAKNTNDLLNQPLILPNGSVIKNRLVKSAMSEALGTIDNHATEALPKLYGRWAAGGVGLLITGNVMIDRRAIGEPSNVVIEDESDLPILKKWAEAGRRNHTQIWVQLNHPGRQTPKGLGCESVAPSAVPFGLALRAFFETPRALTALEIEGLIARFARAAGIVKKAGFTGVQLHGAHGYLISQFLSPLTNQRTDEWGGSSENRQRFVLEIYRAIRAEVGPEFPIGIKLNSADFQKGGFTEEESLNVIRALEAAGIDLIELSGGTYEAPAMSKGNRQADSTKTREAYFLEFAAKIRDKVKLPLMVTGGFRTGQGMGEALASGAMDLVGLARTLALEPELPARLLRGDEGLHPVQPLTTGIKAFDKAVPLEIVWYTRHLHRMGRGQNPRPGEPPLWTAIATMLSGGLGAWRTRRLRA